MTKSINDWVSHLSAEPLPVMRHTLTRVKLLLNRASASRSSFRDVIECDPGFSLYVFRRLNSLPKQPKEPVSKLGNAISLLGMGQIEQAVQKLPAVEDRIKGAPRRNLLDCYSRAAHAAIYANTLTQGSNTHETESLTTAALLHDLGEMALCSVAPEIMHKILQRMQQGNSREDAAVQVLGFTLEELNQILSSHWQLPVLVQESQRLYNSYLPQPLSVMLAYAMARDSAQSWTSPEILEHQELLAEYQEISPEQAQALLHQTAALAARKLQVLPIPLPAFRLAESAEVVAQPPPKQSEITSPPKPIQPAVQTKTEQPVQPIPERKPSVPKRPATPHNPLHESLTRTLNGMKDQHGLENVMFAMLSSDRLNLIARFVVARQHETELKGFQVSLQKTSLFSALMKKPQALWLNPGNLHKYRQMIPETTLQMLSSKGFLIMSIFIKNKPIGLFYADNGWDSEALTTNQYSNFKVLCRRFIQELS